MSILYENDLGYFISHAKFIREIYNGVNVNSIHKSYDIIENIFNIKYPYVKPKLKNVSKKKSKNVINEIFKVEVEYVKSLYERFRINLIDNKLIYNTINHNNKQNTEALIAAQNVYNISGECDIQNIIGENTNEAVNVLIKSTEYIFPEKCKFYCADVNNIEKHLKNEKFDLILLDPPWWNKYIRRKKLKTNNSYVMMYNDDLKNITIENFIKDNGLVVVWCTNSESHLDYLKEKIFKKWNLKYLRKWYWMKVTIYGEPVCNFSDPPGKQPFEQIIFAARHSEKYVNLPDNKLVVSVPSALHSHKPPLQDILKEYISENAQCLEIFARYLLPNWTSYGLEALRFQHHSLYKQIK